jgi:hypothetical protein
MAERNPKLCDYLDLKIVKQRCKRYDIRNESHSTSKLKLVIPPCNVHGNIGQDKCIMKLDTQKKFISFICFLLQFKFKLLNIEDINQWEKERQRKDMCNLLYSMLENCDPSHYYYPIRALSEFYS